MSASPLPSYEKLVTLFKKTKSDLNPAQTHGILCGHLCITPGLGEVPPQFEMSILHEKKAESSFAVLSDLYQASYQSLKQFSFEFSLVLPNDKTDINSRVEALGLWCQGFLIGLEQSQVSLQKHPEKEIAEALDDIAEIAQVSFGDIPDNDEEEAAYLELVEYTRLTALMLFNTLQSTLFSQQNDMLLH